jgi:two-component system, LytTR family, sensor kinase
MNNIFSKRLVRNFFIIICAAVTLIVPIIYYIDSSLAGKPTKFSTWMMGFLFTFMVTVLISIANLSVFKYFNDRYLNHKKYVKLFILELIICSINSAIIMAFVVLFFYFVFGEVPDGSENLKSVLYENVVVAVVINAIICGFAEIYVLFRQWKQTTLVSERLRREKAESQYAALKNQVNPHFLFNSLNTLSSLIRVSPDKAIEFVDKFSKIYRYVLESTDKMVIELRDEVTFIQSYIYLQKIRFGENLNVELNIDVKYFNYYIPPLSIQMLIENALKHNEVSTDYPLKINIEIESEYLIISNNLQLKKGLEESTGIGLKNLEARYDLITELKPVFIATSDKYIAKIPLLKDTE